MSDDIEDVEYYRREWESACERVHASDARKSEALTDLAAARRELAEARAERDHIDKLHMELVERVSELAAETVAAEDAAEKLKGALRDGVQFADVVCVLGAGGTLGPGAIDVARHFLRDARAALSGTAAPRETETAPPQDWDWGRSGPETASPPSGPAPHEIKCFCGKRSILNAPLHGSSYVELGCVHKADRCDPIGTSPPASAGAAPKVEDPGASLAPTHRCRVCGALWWFGYVPPVGMSWSLRSPTCGKCCDNEPMGAQIESIGHWPARLAAAEAVVEAARLVMQQNAPPNHALAGFYDLKDSLAAYDVCWLPASLPPHFERVELGGRPRDN